MDFLRVRHPDTGRETRVATFQYDRHLAALGFTVVEEVVADDLPDETIPQSSDSLSDLDGITPEIAAALADLGVTTREELSVLSDEELDALPGVGLATVGRIRAALSEEPV